MECLVFNYRDAQGQESVWIIKHWQELGKYIAGTALKDERYRTFRKDRILAYLDASEMALETPFVEPPPPPIAKPDILFTGFPAAQRAELEAIATENGMSVRKSVTQQLIYLCCGGNAGPTKVEGARKNGAFILTEGAFIALIKTGELNLND